MILKFILNYLLQFVDPLVLMRNCQRKVSFLIAEKSMKRKYVGAMARALNASKYNVHLSLICIEEC